MAFDAKALRILIASPSDTVDARQALIMAITEWNDLNSESLGVVLVPTLWEISATPETGDRPQAIINRQVVDGCDVLVGTFWTRLGTPTGVDISGTAEEIERMIKRGAQVLLYFSNQPVAPSNLDPDQLRALSEYKADLQTRGLCSDYESIAELGHKVQRDLRKIVEKLSAAGLIALVTGTESGPVAGRDQDIARFKADLRRLVAATSTFLAPLIDGQDVDGVRNLMGTVAQNVAEVLGEMSAATSETELSAASHKMSMLSQEAARLSRFRVYIDGGRSWRELTTSAEKVLNELTSLAGEDWTTGQ